MTRSAKAKPGPGGYTAGTGSACEQTSGPGGFTACPGLHHKVVTGLSEVMAETREMVPADESGWD